MKAIYLITLITGLLLSSTILPQNENQENIKFIPVHHATFIIETSGAVIYIDPVGDLKSFENFPSPDIILVTHAHGDHYNKGVIKSLKTKETTIIVPQSVYDDLKEGYVLDNGESTTVKKIKVEAIPAYNLTKDRLNYHPKGNGNGYVVNVEGTRIYISGDTEDIEEMRELKNIDYAFVCMNLPYTMTVDQAASAVLEFKPKVVYPYHYRSSDVEKFKELVSVNKDIEVRLLDWYK